MGIQIDWGNVDNTLIIWKIEDYWNIADVTAALAQTQALISNSGRAVSLICDIRMVGMNSWHVVQATMFSLHYHLNTRGKVVVLTNSLKLVRMYGNMRLSLPGQPRNVQMARTVDHAYNIALDFVNDLQQ